MDDKDFKELNENVAYEKTKALGRPIGNGPGTWTTSCSVPYPFKELCFKYSISPSNALKEGILMFLELHKDFPQTEYEEIIKQKGVFLEQKKKFSEIINKIGGL